MSSVIADAWADKAAEPASSGTTDSGLMAGTAPAAATPDRALSIRSVTRWLIRAPPELRTSPGRAIRRAGDSVGPTPEIGVGVEGREDNTDAARFRAGKPATGFVVVPESAAADCDEFGVGAFDDCDADEFGSDGAAHATPWQITAAPTPSATANPPTRPMQAAAPIISPRIVQPDPKATISSDTTVSWGNRDLIPELTFCNLEIHSNSDRSQKPSPQNSQDRRDRWVRDRWHRRELGAYTSMPRECELCRRARCRSSTERNSGQIWFSLARRHK
jgi:hypothetical protein